MAPAAEPTNKAGRAAPRARRLSADARRSSILKAARKAFSQTGDMNGTTMRSIADRAGISEGVIYRHFDSKDQLFVEAVVDPLRGAIDSMIAASEMVEIDAPLTPERQIETLSALYRQLIATLEEVMPLLGLVLFGDPKIAKRFYREQLVVAMDQLGEAWAEVQRRHGVEGHHPEVAARAVMGMALLMAIDSHYGAGRPDDDLLQTMTQGTCLGFFPPLGVD